MILYGNSPRSECDNQYACILDLKTETIEHLPIELSKELSRKCAAVTYFHKAFFIFGGYFKNQREALNYKVDISDLVMQQISPFPIYLKTCFACIAESKIFVTGNNKLSQNSRIFHYSEKTNIFNEVDLVDMKTYRTQIFRVIGEYNGQLFAVFKKSCFIYDNFKFKNFKLVNSIKGKLMACPISNNYFAYFITEDFYKRRLYRINPRLFRIECIQEFSP